MNPPRPIRRHASFACAVRPRAAAIAALGASLLALAACQTVAQQPVPPTSIEAVGEMRPGYARGYLDRKALPDSLALLPRPPAEGSAEQAADLEAYRSTRTLRGSARWEMAANDAALKFPQAAQTFSCALDLPISAERTPHLNMLLRRTLADAGLATYAAKNHYQRTRPFVALKEGSCTPDDEPSLSKDGSYPSGHAALGWAWALLLAEIAPERANAVLARGFEIGQSRVICGVHWQSDVDAGRVMGAAAVARLHADPAFRAQLAAARAEFVDDRAKGRRSDRDCVSEAKALAR